MKFPSLDWPRAWRWLSTLGLLVPWGVDAEEVIEFEVVNYGQVTDLTDFPYFSEFYHVFLREGTRRGPREPLYIIRNFITDFEEVDDPDDPDDTDFELYTFANYTEDVSDRTERGDFGRIAFQRTGDNEDTIPSGAVGFLRARQPLQNYPVAPVPGLFAGASGTMVWERFDPEQELEVTFNYNISGLDEVREIETNYTVSNERFRVGSMFFEIDESDVDPAFWVFGAIIGDVLEDGFFWSDFTRSDFVDDEDVAGIVPPGVDQNALWNRRYLLFFESPGDDDRDQVPDLIDVDESITSFPWYADVNFEEPNYWAYWLQLWILSEPTTPWDYWYQFGWVFVPDSSTREDFWFYNPTLGWLYTQETWFPTLYDLANDRFLFLVFAGEFAGSAFDLETGELIDLDLPTFE